MALFISDTAWDRVGALATKAPLSVDDSGVVSYTIPAGKKGITFMNVGNKDCWYGDSTVDPSANKGTKMFRNEKLIYKNVRATFSISFKCAASDSTTISINEHD